MIIEITDQAIKDAKDYSNQITTKFNDADNPCGINGGSIAERYYFGYLGEWVFNEFLKICNVKDKVIWSRDADGMADNGDFFFGAKIIDVKTATKPFHKRIMIPLVQFERHHRDYYVAVRLNGVYAEIIGYATYEDIEKAEPENFGYGDTKAILFTKLRHIGELLNQQILRKWEGQDVQK